MEDLAEAPVLVHDDSSLFVGYASWAGRHLRSGVTAGETAARSSVGDSGVATAMAEGVLWVVGDRRYPGAEAISHSLLDMGPMWGLVGRCLQWPVIRAVFGVLFRLIASQRDHLLSEPVDERSTPDPEASAAVVPAHDVTGASRTARLGASIRQSITATPPADTLLTVALLVAVGLVARFDHKVAEPSARAFEHPSVLIGVATTHSRALIPLLAGLVCLLYRRHLRWDDLFDGRRIRWVVMATAASLAATAALSSPNYFFDRSYLADRLIVLALLALIWFRPATVILFAVFVVVVGAQFDYPAGGFTWTHRDLLLNSLLLFGILVTLGGGKTARTMRSFFTGVCILFICAYVSAAGTKVVLGWAWRENLAYLSVGTHANGWLPGSISGTVIDALNRLRWVLIPLTLIVEIGSLLLLAGRRVALFVLPALFGLHVFIFLASGINFLTSWGLLLVAVWVYLALGGRAFGRARLTLVALTLVLAFVSPWLFGTYRLAWLDTPYSYAYQLEAVGQDGTRYRVDLGDMAPYDVLFVHNFLSYLSAAPTVDTFAWGATESPSLADALRAAKTPSAVAGVQARFGKSRYDAARAARFDELVRARFRTRLTSWPNHPLDEILSGGAPPAATGGRPLPVYTGQQPIERVQVRLVQVWWDGHRTHVVADCIVRDISVSGGATRLPSPDACRVSAHVSSG